MSRAAIWPKPVNETVSHHAEISQFGICSAAIAAIRVKLVFLQWTWPFQPGKGQLLKTSCPLPVNLGLEGIGFCVVDHGTTICCCSGINSQNGCVPKIESVT